MAAALPRMLGRVIDAARQHLWAWNLQRYIS